MRLCLSDTLPFRPLKKIIPDNYSPVDIGDKVFIGANTTIMPGIVIGDNCIIGAMSLVKYNVESATIVAGVPAQIIKRINGIG